MRHRMKRYRRFGTKEHTITLFNNLATALIKHERIVTTLAKAKELRGVVDRIITMGKKNTTETRHSARQFILEPELIPKIFGPLRERYATRPGGYTRLLRIPDREFDKAKMAVIELVDNPFPPLREPRVYSRRQSLSQTKDSDRQLEKQFKDLSLKEGTIEKVSAEPKETLV